MSIDQWRAEKATEYLVHSARQLGAAKADAVKAEAMLRVVKALAMKASDEKSAASQERDAYASPEYAKAVEELWEATKTHETLRAEREAAQATIEFWRSANASQRIAERGMGSARS